jgi:uncharacterized membrane protein YgaE (UPF0421/DUF939 family)
MLDFVRKAFRGGLEVILWVNLLLFVVGGGVVGNMLSNKDNNYTFVGIIIGVFIGFLLNVIMGGFVATILNIDKNLEEQKILLSNISAPDDWICNKCGKNNRKNALFCTGCGEKK